MDERLAEIRAIWKQNQWLYVAAGFLLGVLFQPLLAIISTNLNEFLQNIVPEAIGIVFTVMIIDRLYQRREHQREERELKARLIREMNNQDSGIVMRAVTELRAHGWLEDGSLKNIRLNEANFSGVNLKHANFEGVRDLRDDQLAQAKRLWKAIMPDGSRYDGRFNLITDLLKARQNGVDVNNPTQMAKDSEISIEDYLKGQQWAKENAEWLKMIQSLSNPFDNR
jgi:hypothetical protein